MLKVITLVTDQPGLYEISSEVAEMVAQSEIADGFCVVYTPDCDTAMLITSFWDPRGHVDIIDESRRMFPARTDYRFDEDFTVAAAHTKAAITGVSLDLPIVGNKVLLGHSEGVFLADYVGGKQRNIIVKCL